MKNELKKNLHDTDKIWTCENIALTFLKSDLDSALNWIYKGLDVVKKSKIGKNDKARFTAFLYFDIGAVYIRKKEYDLSIEYYFEAIKNFSEINDLDNVAGCYTNIGFCENSRENLTEADKYYYKAVDVYKKVGNKKGMSIVLNNLGTIYLQRGDYDNGLKVFQRALKLKEELNDDVGIANVLLNIGAIHKNINNQKQALDYFFIALEKYITLKDLNNQGKCYSNIGITYRAMKNYEVAIQNFNKGIDCYNETGNETGLINIMFNMGTTYFYQEKYDEAYQVFIKHLEISKKNNEKVSMTLAHNNLGAVEKERKNYKNAIFHLTESIKILKEIKLAPNQLSSYLNLSEVYERLGDYKTSLEHFKTYNFFKDSIFQIDKEKQYAVLEAKFQNEKKAQQIKQQETEIAKQKAENEAKSLQLKQEKTFRYSVITGFILVIILVFFIYKNYRQKKKSNLLLIKQNIEIQKQSDALSELNEELTQKNEEISSQRDEIEAQRNLVTNQKLEIENIYNELMDSIKYALRIQNAVLPSEEYLGSVFNKYFVYFKPLEVVSGDFFWTISKDQHILFCVADCTGHGVPGSFMSMLGISLLNEIVRKKEVIGPAQVLNELREKIILSLNQKRGLDGKMPGTLNRESDNIETVSIQAEGLNETQLVKDGMDIAFCIYNKESGVLEYSGAYNPCWIIEKNPDSGEKSLIELTPDRMPIGLHYKTDDFTNKSIVIKKGATIYLLSDGFPDQFGRADKLKEKTGGRKFMHKRLKELLISISDNEMEEQKNILERTFNEWKEGYKQIDDVTIMGVRV
jgi:tetratricopeptide (TPR) repeat protein